MYLDGIKKEEQRWKKRESEEIMKKQHDIQVLKNSLSNQIQERENHKKVDRRMEEYYGKQLKERDENDFKRERKEQEMFRNQQKTYLSSLNNQVRLATNRRKFEDMMTDQERQLNKKDLSAYELMEPKLYSNKIGFHNSPVKSMGI
jgi:hypothetical protein